MEGVQQIQPTIAEAPIDHPEGLKNVVPFQDKVDDGPQEKDPREVPRTHVSEYDAHAQADKGEGEPGLNESEAHEGEPEETKDKDSSELPPSELGTKEYWDNTYSSEIEVYSECGVLADGWFGKHVLKSIISGMDKLERKDLKESRILDLGCGNGDTIRALMKHGYKNLTGYDYSENAIALCQLSVQPDPASSVFLHFKVVDMVEQAGFDENFDICIDKGTYDAISLNPDLSQKEARKKYLKNVYELLGSEGSFILSSCNWTTEELVDQVRDGFILQNVIPTKTFSFGGKSGSTLGLAVFRKNNECHSRG